MYGTWGVNKLTDADRKEIWLRRDEGVSMPDLAKRFNVSTTQIWRVCQERRIRTNVKTPDQSEQWKNSEAEVVGKSQAVEAGTVRESGRTTEKAAGDGSSPRKTARRKDTV